MSLEEYYDDFVACLLRADRPAATDLVSRALAAGNDPGELLLRIVQPSMQRVGELWGKQQASLTQYFVAGKIADDVTDRVAPLVEARGQRGSLGRVVIGTITGDYHGLGRKIVAAFLRAGGFQVRDLGMNVSPEMFVDVALEDRADIIAVSALMMHGVELVREIRPLLEARANGRVKLVVGGAPFNYHKRLYRQVGADATAKNAGEAVKVMRGLLAVSGVDG